MCNGIEFVNRIDQLLEEQHISRKDLGTIIDLGPSTISAWKTRNILPPVETIEKIANHFNVSIEWLLTGTSYKYSDSKYGKLNRKTIRDRIYKTLASRLNKENADNEIDHLAFFSNIPEITYSAIQNWAKGYFSLEPYTLEIIAYSLNVSIDYLLSGNESQTLNKSTDQNIYETAIRNLNDLFCLDNLSEERRKLAKDMLNQLMKLEHLEYVEKNRKNTQ